MKSTPFFSLIIPCYNSAKYIRRLMDSLVAQNMPKQELEIIVVDDASTDKSYLDIIDKYDLNITTTTTTTEVHCPGNTRRAGMGLIHGQWLFFCDHDDYFMPNILPKVKDYILKSDIKPLVLCTLLGSWNEEKQEFTKMLEHRASWLHGKFYNVNDLIKPYNVNFKPDLITHEDVYFNSLILSILYKIGRKYDYYDIITYKWVEEKTSITRSYGGKLGYMFDNFEDYIIAATDPYWSDSELLNHPGGINQIMMTLLHCYFYYEAASYYIGPDELKDIAMLTQNLIYKICDRLHVTLDDIVDTIYSDANKYKAVRDECVLSTSSFIEKTSFRDFVYRLGRKTVNEFK